MELVSGTPITEYCDEAKLTTKQRLDLFIKVCRAIQHAHQKGIIHRDIKPSNVLITAMEDGPQPKVIDFGVAKAINQQLTEQTLYTAHAQMIGTPLYMSLEQAEKTGFDIDTRSDVYSLGVLLYELLTGATPFDKETMKQAGYDEMRRIIREEEPQRPSARIGTLKLEQLTTISDQHGIDPRKYSHALSGELDWIVMQALEKDRTRRYESASAFAADIPRYLDDDPVEACPPSAVYRLKKLVRRNRGVLTATVLVATALILGIVGTTLQAVRATKAERTANTERDTAQTQRDRAVDAEQLASRRLGEVEEQRKLTEANFNESETQRDRAESNLQLAMDALNAIYLQAVSRDRVFGETDQNAKKQLTDKEKELLQTGLDFYTRIANQNDSSTGTASATAAAFFEIAQLRSTLDDPEGAEIDLSKAIARYEKLTEANSGNAHYFERLGSACLMKGKFKHPLEFSKALADFNETLAIDPDNWPTYAYRGEVYRHLKQYQKALADHLQTLEFQPDNKYTLDLLFQTFNDLGQNDKAIAYLDQRIAADPTNADFYRRRGIAYTKIAQFAKALADYNKAIELDSSSCLTHSYRGELYLKQFKKYGKALADFDKSIQHYPTAPFRYKRRALTHFYLKNYDKALADIARAVELNPGDPSNLTWVSATLVAKCPDETFRDGLLKLADRTVELTKGIPEAYITRGYLKARLDNLDDALADYERGIEAAKDPGERAQHYNTAAWWIATSPQSTQRHIEKAVEWVEKATNLDGATDAPASLYQPSQPFNLMQLFPGVDRYAARGALYAVLKMNDRARADFEKAVSSDNASNYSHYIHALACLKMGNPAEFRNACLILLEKFAATENPTDAYFSAWTCALAPKAVDDYSLAIELAERALKADPKPHQHQQCLGAVLYRDGKFDDAIEHLNKAVESDKNERSSAAYGLYFLAMTHHRLGNAAKAREFLDRANQHTNRKLNDAHSSASWNLRFTLDLLRKEASQSLGVPAEAKKPNQEDN
jgi:tetratricopeptide (TPR) repeat protein